MVELGGCFCELGRHYYKGDRNRAGKGQAMEGRDERKEDKEMSLPWNERNMKRAAGYGRERRAKICVLKIKI